MSTRDLPAITDLKGSTDLDFSAPFVYIFHHGFLTISSFYFQCSLSLCFLNKSKVILFLSHMNRHEITVGQMSETSCPFSLLRRQVQEGSEGQGKPSKCKSPRVPPLNTHLSCSEARGAASLMTSCWPLEIVPGFGRQCSFRVEAEVSFLCWSRVGAQQTSHSTG